MISKPSNLQSLINSLLKNISDTQYKKYNLDSLKLVPNDFFIDSKKEFKPGSLNDALFLKNYYIIFYSYDLFRP